MDFEEFISIFANGRGIPAQGPIPPGIFGYRDGEAGINPYVYDWVDGTAQRAIPRGGASGLLAEAGYPDGIETRRPASRWCSTSTRRPAGPTTRRGSTGSASSSPSSTSSS